MMYGIQLTLCGLIFLPSFIKIGTSIEEISRLLPPQFDVLVCDLSDLR
jgi:hypothetical protein